MTTIDWNGWRREHPRLTFHDQQAFYARVAEIHPCQQHFDLDVAHRAFDAIPRMNLHVTELGGWDGALAHALLTTRSDIRHWRNFDLIQVEPQVPSSHRYELVVLGDYLWNFGPITGDVFVSTHTIEHLTGDQLGQLVGMLHTEWVYFEAPLGEEGSDWSGYVGSHILELGWRGVNELLNFHGYHATAASGLWHAEAEPGLEDSSPDKEREQS